MPIGKVKFPQKLPIKNPKIAEIEVIRTSGDHYQYEVAYSGKNDDAMKIKYTTYESDNAPYREDEESIEAVKMKSWGEAYYDNHFHILYLHKGRLYCKIWAMISDEKVKKLGEDTVIQALKETGESLEK